jgi:hypothetical protein
MIRARLFAGIFEEQAWMISEGSVLLPNVKLRSLFLNQEKSAAHPAQALQLH